MHSSSGSPLNCRSRSPAVAVPRPSVAAGVARAPTGSSKPGAAPHSLVVVALKGHPPLAAERSRSPIRWTRIPSEGCEEGVAAVWLEEEQAPRERCRRGPYGYGSGLGDLDDVLGLQPLRPFDDVKAHSVTFGQGAESLGDDRGMVDEDVRTMLAHDEAVPLGVVEPLHGTLLRHTGCSLQLVKQVIVQGRLNRGVFHPATGLDPGRDS